MVFKWHSSSLCLRQVCSGVYSRIFQNGIENVDAAKLPLADGETVDTLCDRIFPVIFDPKVMSKRVNQADGEDLVLTSAANYYDGVTQQEAEEFYNALKIRLMTSLSCLE